MALCVRREVICGFREQDQRLDTLVRLVDLCRLSNDLISDFFGLFFLSAIPRASSRARWRPKSHGTRTMMPLLPGLFLVGDVVAVQW